MGPLKFNTVPDNNAIVEFIDEDSVNTAAVKSISTFSAKTHVVCLPGNGSHVFAFMKRLVDEINNYVFLFNDDKGLSFTYSCISQAG